jgi:hypothetical protein
MGSGATAELARDTRQATVRPFEQGDARAGSRSSSAAPMQRSSIASAGTKSSKAFSGIGRTTPLEYEFRLLKGRSIPQNSLLNPKYRAMIALWNRLPHAAANVIGPHIVRSLG